MIDENKYRKLAKNREIHHSTASIGEQIMTPSLLTYVGGYVRRKMEAIGENSFHDLSLAQNPTITPPWFPPLPHPAVRTPYSLCPPPSPTVH